MKTRLLSMYIFATMLAMCSSFAAGPSTVHLRGQLKDMDSNEVVMRYNGASSMLGDSRDIVIKTDDDGKFDIVINLSKPEYYSISRNTLYLSPGDDMIVSITTNNAEAEFAGKGAEANTYLKKRLFPKGGSFLESGDNLKADFAATKVVIDSLAAIRMDELNALDGVSAEFKTLERARLNADIINSYVYYPIYSDMLKNVKNREAHNEIEVKFIQTIAPELNKLYKQIIDDKFLDVDVVRNVTLVLCKPTFASCQDGVIPSERTQEFLVAFLKSYSLRGEINQNKIDDVLAFAKDLKNKDFANELNLRVARLGKLVAGNPAPDLVIQTMGGQTKKLSDFKGQNIYIDFWATWCGPCIKESPYFEELSKKYAGKDIVFLPISTDDKKEDWLNYLKGHDKSLTQYCSQDGALSEGWAIESIPRFILIDKDFNIVDAKAPRPSSKEISGAIDALLRK